MATGVMARLRSYFGSPCMVIEAVASRLRQHERIVVALAELRHGS